MEENITIGVKDFNPSNDKAVPIVAIYFDEEENISVVLSKHALANNITNEITQGFLQQAADYYKTLLEDDSNKK